MTKKIVRSAKSGRFVPSRLATEQPEATISQTPLRMSSLVVHEIARRATMTVGFPVTVPVVMAVHRASRAVSRLRKIKAPS
jgi:hypothetical protein